MSRPRQVSDEEILEAARACFLDDPNASTVTIAQRIGLSQAALFKRFGTKLGLMLAAMGMKDGPPWIELAKQGPDDRPIPEQLLELGLAIDGFFGWMIPRVAAMKAVGIGFRQMFGNARVPPPVRGYEALRDWFARGVTAGRIRPGDPSGLAISFLGMFQGRAFWRHATAGYPDAPFPDDAAYVQHVVDLFWRGVVPEGDEP
ncbi:MAG: TetR/AcrR family transcriptional regulator [Alphaproteobacteria bacterium]|nr:TetR/AcrR family transcriptional regulator [Alphaproteobacteria bacterium]